MGKFVHLPYGENSCGLGCLIMLLVDYSKDKDYVYLESPKKDGALNLQELSELSHREGLLLDVLKVDDKEELYNNKDFPLMLVTNVEKQSHMVILDGIRGKYAYLRDPALGKRKVKLDDLISSWSGIYLKPGEYKGSGYSYPVPKRPRSKGLLQSLAFGIVSYALLALGLYFISDEGSFIVTLLCLLGYAVLEILGKKMALKGLNEFDTLYLHRIALKGNYDLYCRYKTYYFSSPLSVVASVVSAGFLIVLFLMNDFSFLIPLGLLLGYLFLDCFLLEPKHEEKSFALEAMEKAVAKEKTVGGREEILDGLFKGGASEGNAIAYRKALLLLVEAVGALVGVLLGPSISLNAFLLSFFALHAVGEALKGLFTYLVKRPRYEGLEAAFLSLYGESE